MLADAMLDNVALNWKPGGAVASALGSRPDGAPRGRIAPRAGLLPPTRRGPNQPKIDIV